MSITLADLELSSVAYISGGTGNNKLTNQRARITHLVATGTTSLVFSIEAATTFGTADVVIRPPDGETRVVDLTPYGWMVDAISTSVSGTGQTRIFYILED